MACAWPCLHTVGRLTWVGHRPQVAWHQLFDSIQLSLHFPKPLCHHHIMNVVCYKRTSIRVICWAEALKSSRVMAVNMQLVQLLDRAIICASLTLQLSI